MASGDSLLQFGVASNQPPSDWTVLPFTSGGTTEIAVGDTITGATSGSTAVVVLVELTSGTWAGGDAAGFFVLKSQDAAFQAENLDVGASSNLATIAADSTPASASPARRNGHPMLEFDDTDVEIAVFAGTLPQHYDGGGITVHIPVAAATDTTNDFVFSAAIERVGEVLDIDTDSWAALQDSSASTVNGTAGIPDDITVAFTDGAQMDSLAVGEPFRLLICRRSDLATDDATDDAQVIDAVEIQET